MDVTSTVEEESKLLEEGRKTRRWIFIISQKLTCIPVS